MKTSPRGDCARNFDTVTISVNQHYQLDQRALADWQSEQHLDDDDEPIAKTTHGLDAETVRAMIRLVLPPIGRTVSVRNLHTGFKRFLIIAMLIDDDLGAHGFTTLADTLTKAGLPTTRASLSQIHTELADVIGNYRLGKSLAGRVSYSERSRKVWALKMRKNAAEGAAGQSEGKDTGAVRDPLP